MTQIIKSIYKYLYKTNIFLPESQPYFIFLSFSVLCHTWSCIKVPSKFLCASQMSNPKKTDNASIVEWFRIMLEGWIVQHVWDHLKKTISVSPSKATPSFSEGIWKACPWNVNHSNNGSKERVEWETNQKTEVPGWTGYESGTKDSVKCQKKTSLYFILMLALDEHHAMLTQNKNTNKKITINHLYICKVSLSECRLPVIVTRWNFTTNFIPLKKQDV